MRRRGLIHMTSMMAVLAAVAVYVGMPSYAELEFPAEQGAERQAAAEQSESGLAVQGAWIYGSTLEQSGVTLAGSMFDQNGDEIPGSFQWLDTGATAPTGDGSAQVGYRFLPDHDPTDESQGAVTVSYARRFLDVGAVTLANKTYDGSPVATVASYELSGVLDGDDHLIAEVMQGVTAVFDDPGAGGGKDFTVYLGPLSQEGAACYEIAQEGYPYTGGSIHKALATAAAEPVQANVGGEHLMIHLDEAIVLTGLPQGGQSGGRTYHLVARDDPDHIIQSAAVIGDTLTVSIGPGTEGLSAALRIAIEADNLDIPGEVTLTIQQINKTAVDFTVTIDSKVYDGEPVKPVPSVSGDWTYRYTYSGATADGAAYGPTHMPPVDAGTYTAGVVLDSSTHSGAYETPAFVIEPKTVVVRAQSPALPVGAAVRFTYTYAGFVEGEDETNAAQFAGAPEAVCADGTDKAGSYPITFTALPTARNYVFAAPEQPDLLTVTPRVIDRSYFTVAPDNEGLWFNGDITIAPTNLDGFDTLVLEDGGETYARNHPFVLSAGESVGSVTFRLRRGDSGIETEPYPFQYQLDNAPPLILDIVFEQSEDRKEGTLTVKSTDRLSGVRSIDLTLPSGVRLTAMPQGGTAVFSVDADGDYLITVTDHAGNHVSTYKQVVFQTGSVSTSRALWSYSVVVDEMPEESFWRAVRRQIWSAADGDAIRVELSDSADTVPAAVLSELAGKEITVTFVWPGGGSAQVVGTDIGSVSGYGSYTYDQLLRFERQSVRRTTPGAAVKVESEAPSQIAKSNIGGESFVISAPELPLTQTPASRTPAATSRATDSGQAAASTREPQRGREESQPDGDADSGDTDERDREPVGLLEPDQEPEGEPYSPFDAMDALQASLPAILEPAVAGAARTGVLPPLLMLVVVLGVVSVRVYLKQKHDWML